MRPDLRAQRRGAAPVAAIVALALFAPSAPAVSAPPTELDFAGVAPGTDVRDVYRDRGLAMEVVAYNGRETCGGAVVQEGGAHVLRVSCPTDFPILRVRFTAPQYWVGLKVDNVTVPVQLTSFFLSGSYSGHNVEQWLPSPDPAGSRPIAISSAGGPQIGSVTLWSADPGPQRPRPEVVRAVAFSQSPQPDVEITSAPRPALASTTATFAFAASPPTAKLACALDSGAEQPCSSPFAVTVPEGRHALSVRVTDDGYLGSSLPQTVTWTSDVTPPETGVRAEPAPGPYPPGSELLGLESSEPDVSYECRLDGSAFAACPSNPLFRALAPGAHRAVVRAIDAAGNADPTPADARWTFNPFPPLRPPSAGQEASVKVLGGTIRVFLRKRKGFVDFAGAGNVPIGTDIDARGGRIALTAAAGYSNAATQSARVSAGIFRVSQRRARHGQTAVTDLRLRTPAGRATACAATAARPAKGVVRTLSVAMKGRFRTVGSAATATARNARLSVSDTCAGTRVTVTKGIARIRAHGRKRPLRVRAGHSVLVRARLFAARRGR